MFRPNFSTGCSKIHAFGGYFMLKQTTFSFCSKRKNYLSNVILL